MPVNNPSVWKMVSDGGILMGPFLLLSAGWLWISIEYLIPRRRTLRRRLVLLWFPAAFAGLAVGNWSLHWHKVFGEMALSGPLDPEVYTDLALVTSRSTLVVCTIAGFSLATALIAIVLRPREGSASASTSGDGT